MSSKAIFWTGILGVLFFTVTSLLGELQFEEYNPLSQYISETYATGTPYGMYLRFLGFIPSGILLTAFAFGFAKKFPESRLLKIGFQGIGVFYGIATIIASLFPCDAGCNKEFINPSISQLIHNLTGLLTYLFVPLCIIGCGIGLYQLKVSKRLTFLAFFCGLLSLFFMSQLSNPLTNYAGLYQRLTEGLFMSWIVASAVFIRTFKAQHSNPV